MHLMNATLVFYGVYSSSFVLAGMVAFYLGGLFPTDIVYNALPLYHSSAGMLALGPSFLKGVSIAMRSKFSASNFWKDCVRYHCTVCIFLAVTFWRPGAVLQSLGVVPTMFCILRYLCIIR